MSTAKLFALAIVLVSSLTAAPLTVKGQGSRPEPVDSTPFTVSGVCAFPVELSLAGKTDRINLPGERFIITSPGQNVTLTNGSDSSKSVTLNITGSSHQSTQNGNTVTAATGRNLQFDPVAGFVLAIGSFSFAFDAAGNLVQPLTGHGQLTDVCKLIS